MMEIGHGVAKAWVKLKTGMLRVWIALEKPGTYSLQQFDFRKGFVVETGAPESSQMSLYVDYDEKDPDKRTDRTIYKGKGVLRVRSIDEIIELEE